MNRQIAKLGVATLIAVGMSSAAFAQADNSNSKVAPASFSSWMTDQSKVNQGRISRDAYMQESGRRWDAMDRDRQGLNTDQINTLYGYPSVGLPDTRDNMTSPSSPSNVKK